MSFVRDPAYVRRLAGMRGFGDASSPFVNPDGSPTYNNIPYDPYDTANPFNIANNIDDPPSLMAAGYTMPTSAPAPAPSVNLGPVPTLATPSLVNYTPGGNAGTAVSATGLPASTLTAPPAATPSLASLLGPLASMFGGTSLTNALSPSGGVVPPKPATTTTGPSTSTLLILGLLGVGAFMLLRKKR